MANQKMLAEPSIWTGWIFFNRESN